MNQWCRWPTVPMFLLIAGCAAEPPGGAAPGAPVPVASAWAGVPSATRLATLPDGAARRRFILDCTGCHTFRTDIAYPGGQPRTEESWRTSAARMIENFGAASAFPVIGAERDAAETAAWLTRVLPPAAPQRAAPPAAPLGRADYREYEIPAPGDLPHDVAVTAGRVIVTGMFTARMYVLDPESGVFTTEPTPEANPRAIEIGPDGSWWVVLGGPQRVARRAPTGEWTTFDAGFYAHSVDLDDAGGVWVNGHFTHAPELVRRIDPSTSSHRDFTVPPHPSFATTPMPYEIRIAPDGTVWMTELLGNRLVGIHHDGRMTVRDMPTPWSGPRRHDIDDDGVLWIPEYAASRLARYDPRTDRFEEYDLPIEAAGPYVARWDARRRVVWIGTGAADAVLRFDPVAKTFRVYPLPSPDQLVRHMDIDPASGDIWLAPGASPGSVPARVVRMRPLD